MKNFTYDDELCHYGVKGMKWHKRKAGKKELSPKPGKGNPTESMSTWVSKDELREWDNDAFKDPDYSIRRSRRNGKTVDNFSTRSGYRGTMTINRTPVNMDGTSATNRYHVTGTARDSRGAYYDSRSNKKKRKK